MTSSRQSQGILDKNPEKQRHRLLHYVKLDSVGGVGAQFVDFVATTGQTNHWHADVVLCGRRRLHPLLKRQLPRHTTLYYEKYFGTMKLPGWPRCIRRTRQHQLFNLCKADVALIWNEFGRSGLNVIRAVGAKRCVYWERGTAWTPGVTRSKKAFIRHLGASLANSYASKRMLQLRWGYKGQIQVVHNALRPSLRPANVHSRQAPKSTYRLGLAGRLIPIKGVAIALHATAQIRKRGYDVSLDVAGDGPDRHQLRTLAEYLGIGDVVRFLGLVSDMATFYDGIDVLIHPALQESFGLIANEAHAFGVPTIVTAVDGLVEAVAHNVSGICVEPTEPLSTYPELGGRTDGLPPYVYHPAEDMIDAPRLVAPDKLADAVVRLMEDKSLYERLSEQAVNRLATHFDFEVHVHRVVSAIDNYLATGELIVDEQIDK